MLEWELWERALAGLFLFVLLIVLRTVVAIRKARRANARQAEIAAADAAIENGGPGDEDPMGDGPASGRDN